MHSLRLMSALLASISVSGCVGAFVPVQTPEMTGSRTIEAAVAVVAIDSSEAANRQNLGSVTGYSCKNKLWDPPATSDAALLQVKIAAAQRGATAISNINCAEGGTSLMTNCWQSFACTATAIR